MNDLLIITGIVASSAAVGYIGGRQHAQWRLAQLRGALRTYRDWAADYGDRINAALELIPTYKRGCNGSLQKVGKILRGAK